MKQKKLIRCCIPPIITAISLFFIDHYLRQTLAFTLAPAFALIVMSIYHGGSLSGVLSGLLVSAYAVYATPDTIRSIIIIASIAAIIAPIYLMRRVLDNGDRVLNKLVDLDIYLAGAVYRWHNSNDKERSDLIKEVHYKIAHIRTLAKGWHDLAQEREKVLDDAIEDMERR